jgi:hypothetical protein
MSKNIVIFSDDAGHENREGNIKQIPTLGLTIKL